MKTLAGAVLVATLMELLLPGAKLASAQVTSIPVSGSPIQIAFDQGNFAWMTLDGKAPGILKINNQGTNSTLYFKGKVQASGIAVDSSNNVIYTDVSKNQLVKISNDGKSIFTVSTGLYPNFVTTSSTGDIWVSNSRSNNVMMFSNSGSKLITAPMGSWPIGITFDVNGDAWVANYYDGTIRMVNHTTGNVTIPLSLGTLNCPSGIKFDSVGNLWVTSPCNSFLFVFSPDRDLKDVYNSGAFQFVTLDLNNHVWVSDSNGFAWEFDSNGQFMTQYTTEKDSLGIASDRSGNVWVANLESNSVSKIASTTNSPTQPTKRPSRRPTTKKPTKRRPKNKSG